MAPGGGSDDTRFMTWALPGENGSTATVRVGVEFLPATIIIVPGPGVVGLIAVGGLMTLPGRRNRDEATLMRYPDNLPSHLNIDPSKSVTLRVAPP